MMNQQSNSSKPDRIGFLDALSGFMSLRVVCIHALANYWIIGMNMDAATMTVPLWSTILDNILRHSTPVFVLISGFRYQLSVSRHPERGYSDYLWQRFHRIVKPYLLWTVIYYFLPPIVFPMIRTNNPVYADFPFPNPWHTMKMLTGIQHPAYQLWFLSMLILVSFTYPVIKKLLGSFQATLPFFALVSFFCSYYYLESPFDYPRYFLYYDIGAFLCFKELHLKPRNFFILGFLGGLISATSLWIVRYQNVQFYNDHYFEEFHRLIIAITMVSLFILIFPKKAPQFATSLGRKSWPIYILHDPMILFGFSLFWYHWLGITSPASIPVVAAVSLASSLLFYSMLKRLKIEQVFF
jgi:peptidoglycan/LPS O-acetylase OafA/YrhL